jgi:hypothetical protein
MMFGGVFLVVGCGPLDDLASSQAGGEPIAGHASDLTATDVAPIPHVVPTIQAAVARAQAQALAITSGGAPGGGFNGIAYNGGPVMRASTVFYIWYGGWANNTAPAILTDLASNIGGSPYFSINTSYTDAGGRVANNVQLGGSASVGYSHGTAIDGGVIHQIVTEVLNAGQLPVNANAVYFVLTSSDVSVAGRDPTDAFCLSFCGWHTHTTIQSTDIKYAFIGNPDRCPSACEAQTSSPNSNAGADGMASIISHELDEAVSDPDLNAWANPGTEENGDLCAWNFGTEYRVPVLPVIVGTLSAAPATTLNATPATTLTAAPVSTLSAAPAASIIITPPPFPTVRANTHLGNRDYLIQTNWLNAGGGSCSNGVRRLQVDVQGAGTATVTSQPSGVSCGGANCATFFAPGTAVTLTASVASDSVFAGWVGCDVASGTTCQVTLGSDRGVIARVNPICTPTCYRSCFAECMSDGGLPRICVPECKALCGC